MVIFKNGAIIVDRIASGGKCGIILLIQRNAVAQKPKFQARIWEPLQGWIGRVRATGVRMPRITARTARRDLLRAMPWLLPGLAILALIALYPLIYQVGIALTDFQTVSIKDGVNSGIWREVREGLR